MSCMMTLLVLWKPRSSSAAHRTTQSRPAILCANPQGQPLYGPPDPGQSGHPQGQPYQEQPMGIGGPPYPYQNQPTGQPEQPSFNKTNLVSSKGTPLDKLAQFTILQINQPSSKGIPLGRVDNPMFNRANLPRSLVIPWAGWTTLTGPTYPNSFWARGATCYTARPTLCSAHIPRRAACRTASPTLFQPGYGGGQTGQPSIQPNQPGTYPHRQPGQAGQPRRQPAIQPIRPPVPRRQPLVAHGQPGASKAILLANQVHLESDQVNLRDVWFNPSRFKDTTLGLKLKQVINLHTKRSLPTRLRMGPSSHMATSNPRGKISMLLIKIISNHRSLPIKIINMVNLWASC
jgi:hypothetical protein